MAPFSKELVLGQHLKTQREAEESPSQLKNHQHSEPVLAKTEHSLPTSASLGKNLTVGFQSAHVLAYWNEKTLHLVALAIILDAGCQVRFVAKIQKNKMTKKMLKTASDISQILWLNSYEKKPKQK